MKFFLSCFSLIVLVGCFPAPFKPSKECSYGNGAITIEVQDSSRSCVEIRQHIGDAQRALIGKGVVTDQEFADYMTGTTIWIKSEQIWIWTQDPKHKEWVTGEYDWGFPGNIVVGYYMDALVHEMEHHISKMRHVPESTTDVHGEWKDPSTHYQEAEDLYSYETFKEECGPRGDCL